MENVFGGYEKYRQRVYTWLLCAKHSPLLQRTVGKDVALMIAKMIEVDLSGWIKWPNHEHLGKLVVWFCPPYEWIYQFQGDFYGNGVCQKCLRPCKRPESDPQFGQWICPVHGLKDSKCEKCSLFGVCEDCTKGICAQQKIHIHDRITIRDDTFNEEYNLIERDGDGEDSSD